ncbi:MAG: hypothetical protein R3F54_28840 [Alphaproteobacteria bacterium]
MAAPAYSPFDLVVLHDPKKRLTKRWRFDADCELIAPTAEDAYGSTYTSTATLHRAETIEDLSRILVQLEAHPHRCVIRDQPTAESYGKPCRRIKYDQVALDGTVEAVANYVAVARQWVCLDVDKICLPGGLDVADDPEACIGAVIKEVARHAPELEGVAVHAHLSSSAGLHILTGDPGGKISVHLWYVLDRPYSEAQLALWINGINERAGHRLIDPVTVRGVQPNFTANPLFVGENDPLPRRSFLIQGDQAVLSLDLPAIANDNGAYVPTGNLLTSRYHQALDLIGDAPGQAGFQEPVKAATWAAARDLGEDLLDQATFDRVKAEIQQRVRERGHTRSDRYISMRVREVDAKLRSALNKIVGNERRQQKAIRERARQDAADTDDNVLAFAEGKLRREVRGVLDRIDRILAMKDRRAELVAPIHDQIEADMARKWGDASLNPAHDDHDAYRADKRRAKAAATRRMSARVARDEGLDKMPKLPELVVIKATTGLGKSRTALEEIAKPRRARFDWMAPNHRLLDQSEADFDGMLSKPHARAVGRGGDDPLDRWSGYRGQWDQSWQTRAMCPRFEVVSPLATIGVNVNQEICPSCPLRGVCGYRAQRQTLKEVTEAGGVVFAPSAYAQYQPIWSRGDVIIIDEAFVEGLFRTRGLKASLMDDPRAIWRLCKDEDVDRVYHVTDHLKRALIDHRGAPVAYLDSVGIGAEQLKAASKALIEGQAKDDAINGHLPDHELLRRAQAITYAGRFEIIAIIRAFLLAMKTGARRLPQIELTRNDDGEDVFVITECAPIRIGKSKPIICLDATVNVELLEAVTGRKATIIEATVKENFDVTLVNTSGSKAALYACEGSEKLDGIMRAFEKFAAGKTCPIFTHKQTAEKWIDEFPENMPVEHFGNLVGMNTYREADRFVVLGRQQPNEAQFLPKAAAVAAMRGREIETVQTWLDRWQQDHPGKDIRTVKRTDGYVDRNGKAWHPDPIVEAMRWRACEGELIQAMGRARSIRAPKPVKVLLVTNAVPKGVEINRAISFRELKKGKTFSTAIEEYVHSFADRGVVPMGPADMARLAPDLFPTVKSAKDATTKLKVDHPIYILSEDGRPFPAGFYRRRGQRGQPCRFLVTGTLSAAETRDAIRGMVGDLSEIKFPERQQRAAA